MLTVPFVQVGAFKAHPTFLDLLNLRSGDSSLAHQVEQLDEILLEASEWANNYCQQPLQAHVQVDNERTFPNRMGQLTHKAWHTPVVSLTSLSSGTNPTVLTAVNVSNPWIEDQREIIVSNGPLNLTSSAGPLQLGTYSHNTEFFTQWIYVAGYANTVLTQTVNQGDTSIHVADATGIVAGSVLRILEPGSREAVTVSNSFVPTTGPATVTLTSPILFTHTFTAGTGNEIGVTALPMDVHLATIMLAVAILLRRTDTPANTAFPGALVRPSASSGNSGGNKWGASAGSSRGQAGQPLIDAAFETLFPYKRVR